MKIKVTIYMEPVGKARPRVVRNKWTGKPVSYTPDKTAHAENLIRDQVMKLEAFFPKECPLVLIATFYRSRPKSVPAKKRRLPVTKPDWDNYGKLLSDALKGFAYAEDAQITTAIIKKRFAEASGVHPEGRPRIELEMYEEGIIV